MHPSDPFRRSGVAFHKGRWTVINRADAKALGEEKVRRILEDPAFEIIRWELGSQAQAGSGE